MKIPTLLAQPLTAEAFEPFGDVLEAPSEFGRKYFDAALGNRRDGARPSLSLSSVRAREGDEIEARVMERHEFSSQSFLPLAADRYLVLVAPRSSTGGPDEARLQAFVATGDQGITYRPDTWHHPLTVFGRNARFAVVMWLDGSAGDEEFVTLAQPVRVRLPSAA